MYLVSGLHKILKLAMLREKLYSLRKVTRYCQEGAQEEGQRPKKACDIPQKALGIHL